MVYGFSYKGEWHNNLMYEEGIYVYTDRITWTDIFVEGSYKNFQKVFYQLNNKYMEYEENFNDFETFTETK